MKSRNWVYFSLLAIAAITVLSGLTQMIAPGFILKIMSSEITAASLHFFAIVGMFMVLFGGLMLHALLSRSHHPVAILWGGFQKLGAFCAVALGVINGIFSALALLIAFFDLLSGVLALFYWSKIKNHAERLS